MSCRTLKASTRIPDLFPCHQGGKDTDSNLELVHYYCHQQINAQRAFIAQSAYRPSIRL
ncbi:MAG TPA: hypothetical protein DDZ80_30910 [Cyanobacteria bacterium UBA8803]|nr:hypothetical protein [Cyanobacteria bacterium UBA9273]HBL62634.1 hypothetical protein [Cyanobacteria bacterium UBA8803]